MTLESAIFTIATSDGTINGLISGRMYRERLPVNETVPALVYKEISRQPETAHDGGTNFSQARYQIDCWADDPGEAETLENAVVGAFDGYRGTADSRKIGGITVEVQPSFSQPDTQLSRRIVDLLILDEGDV